MKQDQDQDIKAGRQNSLDCRVEAQTKETGCWVTTSTRVQLVGAPLIFHVAVFAALDIVSFLDLT